MPPPPPPPPPPALLCHSQRIAALNNSQAIALLAKYSLLHNSHNLLPLSVSDSSLFPDFVLSALADGLLKPEVDIRDDPLWKDALQSSEHEYWIAGAKEEIQSLKNLQVFILVPRTSIPSGRQPICGKLICKCKQDNSGQICRYKVCYIAKGYTQIYGINYDKTTALTARLESFCVLLHLAASLNWDLQQFDIKTAFLHGVLPPDKIAFMEQPSGFEEPDKENWVWQQLKSIYSMKQASQI